MSRCLSSLFDCISSDLGEIEWNTAEGDVVDATQEASLSVNGEIGLGSPERQDPRI